MNILFVLLIFTIIVLVHELGHFWAARRAGIQVEEFSIGMGPRILKFKRGETIYSLKALPLGGSCRMLGEDEDEEGNVNERSLNRKPIGWRVLVMAGGSVMNFALALIIAIIMSLFTTYAEPTVVNFTGENSPMQAAGAQIGDRITSVNGRSVNVRGDLTLAMLRADGSPMSVTVDRDGATHTLSVRPIQHEESENWLLGFGMLNAVGAFASVPAGLVGTEIYREVGFFESVAVGAQNLSFIVRATFTAIGRLFTHGISELMGPIGMVDVVGGEMTEVATNHGFAATFWTGMHFTMFLSVSLGVLNLLPIPALDGGRLVFLGIEAIRRKPLNPEMEGKIHLAGFALMMGLFVLVAYNDIVRLFQS
ncbi:MAG: site-2 protease family protein [Defluviitaleaceae bacterium]|nr:site-2 protease family protein [Defluviitaleaceae bacterium]